MGPRWRLRAHQGRQRTERAGWALNPGSPRSPCTGCAEHTKDILSKLTAADPADLAFTSRLITQPERRPIRQDARALEYRSRCVIIAGRGYGARSALPASAGDGKGVLGDSAEGAGI